jgi:hypothetical protein
MCCKFLLDNYSASFLGSAPFEAKARAAGTELYTEYIIEDVVSVLDFALFTKS